MRMSSKESFHSWKKLLIPLFEDCLLIDGKVDFSLRYKIPPKMMHKGSTIAHANALPVRLPMDCPNLSRAIQDEDWILTLKLLNLVRGLDGLKSFKGISSALYYLLRSLPNFKKPWEIVNSDFLRASELEGMSEAKKVRIGEGLRYVCLKYNEYGLSQEIIRYSKNPHLRPQPPAKNFLPDLEACHLLATTFKSPRTDYEILATSAFALLNYAPSRASEIVTLDVNCITDLDGFGLRFPHPAKNGSGVVKRSACVEFEEVVRLAVGRLMNLGKSAREASAWYAKNPSKLYIPEHLKYLEGKDRYTASETLAIIGYSRDDDKYTPPLYVYRSSSPLYFQMPKSLSGLFKGEVHSNVERIRVLLSADAWISDADLLQWVTKRFNSTFPYVDGVSEVRYEECIFVHPYSGVTSRSKAFWKCLYVPCFFSASKLQNHMAHTFFKNLSRSDLSLGTHSMRHFLNTLAQTKHIDQRIIAMWSGRSSVEQNEAYDHRAAEEKVETIDIDTMGSKFEFGGFLSELYESKFETAGVSTAEFFKQVVGSLHVTELGFCRHDYSSGPCPNVFQCIDCPEHCFAKDERARIAASKMIDKLKPVIDAARDAVENGEPGALNFLDTHERKLARLQKQVQFCSADNIVPNALCALPPPVSSDNLLSRTIKSRFNQADSLYKKALRDGRAQGIGAETIQDFKAFLDTWSLEEAGLPTWKAICANFERNYGLVLRRESLLKNPETSRMLNDLEARLLESPLVYIDSTLRWHWDIEYLTAQVIEGWDFILLKTPSFSTVADQIRKKFPIVTLTVESLQKNRNAASFIAQKRQQLHDLGYIYLAASGRLICERQLPCTIGEDLDVYDSFEIHCKSWTLHDGLPTIKNVLQEFRLRSGFLLSLYQFHEDKEFLGLFESIRLRMRSNVLIVYDAFGRPSWNVSEVIAHFLRSEVSLVDTGRLLNTVKGRYPGLRVFVSELARHINKFKRGGCHESQSNQ